MRVPVKRSDINIQEKLKNTEKKNTVSLPSPLPSDPPSERKIAFLADLLRCPHPHVSGQVLQVLVGRMRHPEKPYTSKELEVLLLLSLALKRAGMWPV